MGVHCECKTLWCGRNHNCSDCRCCRYKVVGKICSALRCVFFGKHCHKSYRTCRISRLEYLFFLLKELIFALCLCNFFFCCFFSLTNFVFSFLFNIGYCIVHLLGGFFFKISYSLFGFFGNGLDFFGMVIVKFFYILSVFRINIGNLLFVILNLRGVIRFHGSKLSLVIGFQISCCGCVFFINSINSVFIIALKLCNLVAVVSI